MVTPSVVSFDQAKELDIPKNQVVQLWQILDRKNVDAAPRFASFPNPALVERCIRGLLRSDSGNNQYATAPEDWYAVHVCDFVPDRLLYILVDDSTIFEFKAFV